MAKTMFGNVVKILLTLQLFVLALFFAVSFRPLEGQRLWMELDAERWLSPFRQIAIGQGQAEYLLRENSALLIQPTYLDFAGISRGFVERVLFHEIQVLAYDYEDDAPSTPSVNLIRPSANPVANSQPSLPAPQVVPEAATVPEFETGKAVVSADSTLKAKKIVLYCTHNGETYIPDSGVARLNQKIGKIHQVAESLKNSFTDLGVQASFVDSVHDLDYNSSYTNSRKTVNTIIEQEKDRLVALFDLHRDSIPGESSGSVIRVNGTECAQLLIIVGTNERKNHPYWQENMDFAQRIYERAQVKYPGLIKGVRTKAGTYNQEFFNHSLLIECGTDQNKLQEVTASMRLFAEVVLEVLQEEARN